ncbi:hypothetical protein [Oceanobacillus halophilus]|uniref:Spore coat protein YsxE n=1 Tax=Oceanobacillus halophilus TaxID=930130 RepID=A0A495AEG0_9BACI|nr:hypothetical protein [Oceanobacillus halophilus]RKQ37920.1 hypothetical protein D8M06_03735 [Oceanobacillus halophilus]
MQDDLYKVLSAYGIRPLKIQEVTPRLFEVKDNYQNYALKISSLTEGTLKKWENVYRVANAQNLQAVLPVYLTKQGNLFYPLNETVYYLSPWVEEREQLSNETWIQEFYETLATMHVKTRRTQKLSKDKISKRFITYQSFCNDARRHLLTFVQQFEKHRYMSPFELLVCTQFRDIDFALVEVDKRIHRLLNEEKGEEQLTWNYSLCHSNLNASHIRGPYFINWENARYESPIMDLVRFFSQEIGKYDPTTNSYIDLFPTYTKINQLQLPELQLFSIYLLSPGKYVQTIYEYVNTMRTESMIHFVQTLQHEYRKILFGLKWSEYIEKEYETIKFDDLET